MFNFSPVLGSMMTVGQIIGSDNYHIRNYEKGYSANGSGPLNSFYNPQMTVGQIIGSNNYHNFGTSCLNEIQLRQHAQEYAGNSTSPLSYYFDPTSDFATNRQYCFNLEKETKEKRRYLCSRLLWMIV